MSQPYTCYEEIIRQGDAWQECADLMTRQASAVRAFFEAARPSEILFAGCTSPYYIGKSAAAYWQAATGIPARAVTCSELLQFPGAYYTPGRGNPLLVVISRSGKTSETLWAVEAFQKQYPGRVFHIGCAPGSPLDEMVEASILLPKGHEQTLAQTSSFSVMFMAVQMIGALLSGQEDVFRTLQGAPDIFPRLLAQVEPIIQRVMQEKELRNIFFLGSGPLYGVARDAALKMMEMSLSETMCFPFLEARHGPKSIIDEGSLVVGLFSHGGHGYEAQLIEEFTNKYGARTVAVTPTASWPDGGARTTITVDCDWPDGVLGLPYLPVIQLMAYYHAVAKDVNPDLSRNLTQFIEIQPVSVEPPRA